MTLRKRVIVQEKVPIAILHSHITGTVPTRTTAEQKFLQLWQGLWLGAGEKWTTGHKPKPSLRTLAYALAVMVLSIHGPGWVHKSLSSSTIVVIPSGSGTWRFGTQQLIPCVAGWGVARRTSHETTDLNPVTDSEPNLYQHSHQQQ